MKKVVTGKDGRMFDAYVNNETCGFFTVTLYEVKNPEKKLFGRTKFFSFYDCTMHIDDFDNVNDAIYHALEKGYAQEERDNSRIKKWEEFTKEN